MHEPPKGALGISETIPAAGGYNWDHLGPKLQQLLRELCEKNMRTVNPLKGANCRECKEECGSHRSTIVNIGSR